MQHNPIISILDSFVYLIINDFAKRINNNNNNNNKQTANIIFIFPLVLTRCLLSFL